jgi:hypothetical protein
MTNPTGQRGLAWGFGSLGIGQVLTFGRDLRERALIAGVPTG